ncbi:hypothetical protein LEN26_014238 [Aphanomyces euteiches]|nr:hypothetical protein LEN26_014238 [Aphanomyces euteiches]
MRAGNITRDFLASTISAAIQSVVGSSAALSTQQDSSQQPLPTTQYNIFNWDGGLQKLPSDFKFPSVDLSTAWNLWLRGNSANKFGPYRSIATIDIASKKERNVNYEWRFIMDRLPNFYQCQTESFAVVQAYLQPIQLFTAKKRKRRDSQLKVTTLVRLVREMEANIPNNAATGLSNVS